MNRLSFYFQEKSVAITITVIVLLQLLLAFQGFDVCDDGFVLTFYQQIFANPESVEYNFLYWFSGIVGGLWYKLFESAGILWFRILAIIVNTSTFFVVYKLLKPHVKKAYLLWPLIMVLFANDFGFLTYYHNHLTAFMAVLIIYTLYNALMKHSFGWYALAGFLLSLNIFTRLPNLVLFSLILVVPYAYYLRKYALLKSIIPIIYIIIGAIAGLLAVYVTLSFLGHLDIMKNALITTLDLGSTQNSSHNFKSVIKAPYFNFISIAIETTKLCGVILMLYIVKRIIPDTKGFRAIFFIIGTVLFIYWFNTKNIYPVYSLCLIGSIGILFVKRINKELKFIGLLSTLTLATIYLGTGGGIKNSGYMGIWIGLPLFFYLIDNTKLIFRKTTSDYDNLSAPSPQKSIRLFLGSVITGFVLLKAYNISQQAYFDVGSRLDKVYTIKSPLAKGIYTTERRATIINELLPQLNNMVKPGDYLMVYDKMPMLHFLTETKPYMYNPWVWIYDYNSFEKKLIKAEREIERLPVVVQQKFETIYRFSEPIDDYMSAEKENSNFHSKERTEIMNAFLSRNNYEIVWANDYFNIYTSKN